MPDYDDSDEAFLARRRGTPSPVESDPVRIRPDLRSAIAALGDALPIVYKAALAAHLVLEGSIFDELVAEHGLVLHEGDIVVGDTLRVSRHEPARALPDLAAEHIAPGRDELRAAVVTASSYLGATTTSLIPGWPNWALYLASGPSDTLNVSVHAPSGFTASSYVSRGALLAAPVLDAHKATVDAALECVAEIVKSGHHVELAGA